MNRNEKIKAIQGLLSGSVRLKDISHTTTFITHKTATDEPSIFYDMNARPMNGQQVNEAVKEAGGAGLVWHEVKTYENKSSLLNSYQ